MAKETVDFKRSYRPFIGLLQACYILVRGVVHFGRGEDNFEL